METTTGPAAAEMVAPSARGVFVVAMSVVLLGCLCHQTMPSPLGTSSALGKVNLAF
jgi:hypothetical protein